MNDETPTTQRRIGRYLLLEEVGRGGMGTVYRAHDPNLDRAVALKVPHALAGDTTRFQREARAAARVFHPNICPIFDVGEHEGAPFVVMAFVEGHALTHYLENGGTLAILESARVAVEVLNALAAVHAAGIVHRDVKPGNVLIDRSGQVLLTDFGLARPQSGSHLTSDGMIVGTPAYMAPEQAAGRSDEIGPSTDLYAVGVLLYRMLAGRVPFEGTPVEVVAAVLRDEPPSPRQFRAEVDLALEAIVMQAMARRPTDRFADASAFAAALAAYAATFQLKRSEETTTLQVAPAPREARRGFACWRWLGWGIGLTLVALIGVLQAYWIHLLYAQQIEVVGVCVFQGMITLGTAFLLFFPLVLVYLMEVPRWPAGVRRGARGQAGVLGAANVVRVAAAYRVDLDEPNELGETPLMIAAALGHEEVVKVLLMNGSRVDRVNSFNQTAAEIAYANGRTAIYDLLLRAAQVPRPPYTPVVGSRPPVASLVLAALVLGTLSYVLLAWRNGAWPARLEWEQGGELIRTRAVGFVIARQPRTPLSTQGGGQVPVVYPILPPDLWGEVKEPAKHPALLGGRFLTTPPPITSAMEDSQWKERIRPVLATSAQPSWPPYTSPWWPLLPFVHAGLLALLLWLFGLGRLFGLLPRKR